MSWYLCAWSQETLHSRGILPKAIPVIVRACEIQMTSRLLWFSDNMKRNYACHRHHLPHFLGPFSVSMKVPLHTLNAKRADAQVLFLLKCCPQHTKATSPGEDISRKGRTDSKRKAPGIIVNRILDSVTRHPPLTSSLLSPKIHGILADNDL